MIFLLNDEQQKKNSGKIRRVGIGGNPLQNECRCGADSKKIYEKLSPILNLQYAVFIGVGQAIYIHGIVFLFILSVESRIAPFIS